MIAAVPGLDGPPGRDRRGHEASEDN